MLERVGHVGEQRLCVLGTRGVFCQERSVLNLWCSDKSLKRTLADCINKTHGFSLQAVKQRVHAFSVLLLSSSNDGVHSY